MIVGAIDTHLSAILPAGRDRPTRVPPVFSPAAINNLGHIVAQQQLGDLRFGQGAHVDYRGRWNSQRPRGPGNFRPLDINDWDENGGFAGFDRAIAWFEAGALQVDKLPGLSSGNLGVATAINNRGEVVGYRRMSAIDHGTYRPFFMDPESGLSSLAPRRHTWEGLGINDSGQSWFGLIPPAAIANCARSSGRMTRSLT